MKPSIGNKLAGGFGICVLMLSALAGFDFLALEKLGILYHDALMRSSGIELAADAQHIGVDLYQIIADSIINRDVSKSMQLWVDGKQEAKEKLRKMTALADTPMEHAAVADAKQALDCFAAGRPSRR